MGLTDRDIFGLLNEDWWEYLWGMAVAMAECPLCRLVRGLDRTTRVYYEDDVCVVVDCRSCGVPMVVLKRHVEVGDCWESGVMVKVAKSLFPGRRLDFRKRSILDHDHFHVR